MPKTKWSELQLYLGPFDNIYIGKKEVKQPLPGLTLYSEMSDDRTNECVKVVMQHMDAQFNNREEEGASNLNFEIPGFGTLTWTPASEEEEEE